VLGPTHLAPTIAGRHDRHLGGYTASSSAWARYPTLGCLTDRQQPVDDKHSENSPVSTAAAVPACGVSQNAHGFRNETCRAHSHLAVVERTTRVRLFCDPLSAERSSSRQRLGLAPTLPVQSDPQRRRRPGGWASTAKGLAARAFTPSFCESSHSAESPTPSGIFTRIRISVAPKSKANRIPATAAARGVVN
jgi:hypothetical protein